MKISDCLDRRQIAVPLEAADLVEALEALLALEAAAPGLDAQRRSQLAHELASGERSELVSLAPDITAVLASREGSGNTTLHIGISSTPFKIGEGDEPDTARVLVLILTGRRMPAVRGQALPALRRYLREGERADTLLGATSPDEVVDLPGFMDLPLLEGLLVAEAMSPVTYRVYPHTPLHEVVELMVRRELHAVPVVGESYEVMGIITVGDALQHVVPHRQTEDADPEEGTLSLEARNVMTRTVMCVSEDQALQEAAVLMVSRDVEQLPVVREGELVGFLTRDAVLRALHHP